ncbi:hypothetical protein D3C87_1986310 [compost metagenome]
MAVAVILMMASRGLTISGSGTVSTRTSCLPCQVSARMEFVLDDQPRGAAAGAWEVETSPVSISCLKRRSSRRAWMRGSRCITLATSLPTAPAGGS